jgi:hypothetical protein
MGTDVPDEAVLMCTPDITQEQMPVAGKVQAGQQLCALDSCLVKIMVAGSGSGDDCQLQGSDLI